MGVNVRIKIAILANNCRPVAILAKDARFICHIRLRIPAFICHIWLKIPDPFTGRGLLSQSGSADSEFRGRGMHDRTGDDR